MGACRFTYSIVGGLLELGAEQCVKDYHNQCANVFAFSEKQALSHNIQKTTSCLGYKQWYLRVPCVNLTSKTKNNTIGTFRLKYLYKNE